MTFFVKPLQQFIVKYREFIIFLRSIVQNLVWFIVFTVLLRICTLPLILAVLMCYGFLRFLHIIVNPYCCYYTFVDNMNTLISCFTCIAHWGYMSEHGRAGREASNIFCVMVHKNVCENVFWKVLRISYLVYKDFFFLFSNKI